MCRYLLRKNIGAPQSPDAVHDTNYTTVSMFGISTLRSYQLCNIFDIPWLLQTNQADTTSLASRLPYFLALPRPISAQSSSAFHLVRMTAFVLCGMPLSFNHSMKFVFPKADRFVTNNRSCCLRCLRLFRIFIAVIFYILAPNVALHCKWISKFVTGLIGPTDHRHPQSARIIMWTA
jgi:hypothetical protein